MTLKAHLANSLMVQALCERVLSGALLASHLQQALVIVVLYLACDLLELPEFR